MQRNDSEVHDSLKGDVALPSLEDQRKMSSIGANSKRNFLRKVGTIGAIGLTGLALSPAFLPDAMAASRRSTSSTVTSTEPSSSSSSSAFIADPPWNAIGGAPFVMVTWNGPTDGGDYGRNTPGTTTSGIQEALNACPEGGIVFLGSFDASGANVTINKNISLVSFRNQRIT